MDEVEYGIVRKNSKLSADEITKLPQGTIQSEVRGSVRGSFTCTCRRGLEKS